MKLLIVGFNARPIAKSAKQAGHEIGVIDYFGDMDLLKITRNCFSVLRQKPGETLHRLLNRNPADYLYYLAEIMIDEQDDFDGIILGSAFDRYPELIRKFGEIGPRLYANEPEKFALIRAKDKINILAKNAGFAIPKIKQIHSLNELGKNLAEYKFPVVTRRDGGGGGAGIRLWKTEEDILECFESQENPFERELWLQEYIQGIDASASAICSDDKVQILSVNKQLIGKKELGAPSDFAYCGNITPLYEDGITTDTNFMNQLLLKITSLFKILELTGSNGIDFVIKDKQVYFMEINPRMQGSIECIQYATRTNIVQLHLDAFNGKISEIASKPHYKKFGVKGILFYDQEETTTVRKYPRSKWIVDRTHYQTILEKNDPFCSIILPSKNPDRGYKKAIEMAEKIMAMNQEH